MKLPKLLPSIAFSLSTVCFSMPSLADDVPIQNHQESMSEAAEIDNALQAIKESIDNHPELQAKWNAFVASQHDKREVFGDYLPKVDLEAAVGAGDRSYDNRGHFERHLAEVSLTQALFAGFRIKNSNNRAEQTKRVRYYELLDEAQTKALQTLSTYLDVLRYRQLVDLAKLNYANHKRVYDQVERRTLRGVSNKADLAQISGRLALAESNLITESANLHDVSARFLHLVGRLPKDEMQEPKDYVSQIPVEISETLDISYLHNPGLQAAFENIEVATSTYKVSKAHRYPTVDFNARHGVYKNNNGFDNRENRLSSRPHKGWGNESVVEVRLNYNLYNGGSHRAAERAALSRIYEAGDIRDTECLNLRQDVQIAHNDVFNILRKLDTLENHRESSLETVSAYRQQYNIGRRSLLDVLDSENESFQASRAYTHARYDMLVAEFRTLHGMGTLLDVLNSRPSSLAELTAADLEDRAEKARTYCGLSHSIAIPMDELFALETEKEIQLMSDAMFDVNSSKLKPEAKEELEKAVEFLKTLSRDDAVVVTGHTDSTGSVELNNRLSMARAISVRDYLLAEGVTEAVIMAAGVSANYPIDDNSTLAGRAKNRRVEIRIQSGGGQ